MGYHVKISKEYDCMIEECKLSFLSREELQKHYTQDHDLKESLKASLTITGNDYRIDKK